MIARSGTSSHAPQSVTIAPTPFVLFTSGGAPAVPLPPRYDTLRWGAERAMLMEWDSVKAV